MVGGGRRVQRVQRVQRDFELFLLSPEATSGTCFTKDYLMMPF